MKKKQPEKVAVENDERSRIKQSCVFFSNVISLKFSSVKSEHFFMLSRPKGDWKANKFLFNTY